MSARSEDPWAWTCPDCGQALDQGDKSTHPDKCTPDDAVAGVRRANDLLHEEITRLRTVVEAARKVGGSIHAPDIVALHDAIATLDSGPRAIPAAAEATIECKECRPVIAGLRQRLSLIQWWSNEINKSSEK